jgi:hypothetical protein
MSNNIEQITIWRHDNGKWGVTITRTMADGSNEYITGEAIYDDPGEAAYAHGMSIVDGQVTWNDTDIPQ